MINSGNISLIEFATQNSGSVFVAFDYAVKNNLKLSAELLPGQLIQDPIITPIEKDNFNQSYNNFFKDERNVIVTNGQSLMDISIQETGSPFLLIDMAFRNKLSLDDLLSIGNKVSIPVFEENDIQKYFKSTLRPIATYYTIVTQQPSSLTYELPGEFPYSF